MAAVWAWEVSCRTRRPDRYLAAAGRTAIGGVLNHLRRSIHRPTLSDKLLGRSPFIGPDERASAKRAWITTVDAWSGHTASLLTYPPICLSRMGTTTWIRVPEPGVLSMVSRPPRSRTLCRMPSKPNARLPSAPRRECLLGPRNSVERDPRQTAGVLHHGLIRLGRPVRRLRRMPVRRLRHQRRGQSEAGHDVPGPLDHSRQTSVPLSRRLPRGSLEHADAATQARLFGALRISVQGHVPLVESLRSGLQEVAAAACTSRDLVSPKRSPARAVRSSANTLDRMARHRMLQIPLTFSGAEGARTLDPGLAKPVLSQLSYRPKRWTIACRNRATPRLCHRLRRRFMPKESYVWATPTSTRAVLFMQGKAFVG